MMVDPTNVLVDGISCAICNEKIETGESFIEVTKNLGVKEVVGVADRIDLVWEKQTSYVHLGHLVFVQETNND